MMTKREGLLLATRAFGLYLTVWGLVEVTYLPQALLSFLHHASTSDYHDYLWAYYGLSLSLYLVRVVSLFVAARWLLKGGTSVAEFFLPEIEPSSDSQITG
jgi:hypothetical protein